MKMLADDDLGALLSLVGVSGEVHAMNVELPASTMKGDLIVRTATGIVHVEYVKDLTPNLDLRMVDYRLRMRRRHRETPILQHILVLNAVTVPDRYTDIDGQLRCRWNVVRIADLDPATLLNRPTTAALAALAQGTVEQRSAILTAAADLISSRTDPDRRNVLLSAAATLASIVLPRSIIGSALKEATMPVPVRDTPLGRWLMEEGRDEARREARQELVQLTAVMLRRDFGDDPRVDAVAERLAAMTGDERLRRLTAAAGLDDLARE